MLYRKYLCSSAETKLLSPDKFVEDDLSWAFAVVEWFWAQWVHLVPEWVSPNLITLLGSVSIVAPCAAHYILWAIGHPDPSWWCLWAAFGTMSFQACDCLDGMLARRTNTCSALGDFLDHSMDMLGIMTVIMSVAVAVRQYEPWALPLALCGGTAHAFLIQWEHAHTLKLVLTNGSSITEAQLAMSAVMVVCNYYPWVMATNLLEALGISQPEWLPIEITGVTLLTVVLVGALGFFRALLSLHVMRSRVVAKPALLLETVPYFIGASLYVYVFLNGLPEAVPAWSPALHAWSWSYLFCTIGLMWRMIQYRISRQPLHVIQPGLVPLILTAVNNCLLPSLQLPHLDHMTALMLCLGTSIALLLHYLLCVSIQMADVLKIPLLKMSPKAIKNRR